MAVFSLACVLMQQMEYLIVWFQLILIGKVSEIGHYDLDKTNPATSEVDFSNQKNTQVSTKDLYMRNK